MSRVPMEIGRDKSRVPMEIGRDKNGTGQVILRSPRGASAKVSLHGGQVRSWTTNHGDELLFMSRLAKFHPPNAVRGGIPICFPQFRDRGTLEQHGFARKKIWEFDMNAPPIPSDSKHKAASADLLLKSTQDDLILWPHRFEFRLRVSLAEDGNLTMISRIRNVDSKPFSYSIGYHAYFAVSDINEVRVEGLETLDYLDNVQDRKRFTEQESSLTFESEVDRIYVEAGNMVKVLDHQRRRTVVIQKEGLPDVVVWNPWEKRAKALVDFGNEEYKKMLCVDGAASENPITLKPGEEWTGRLELSVEHHS